MIIDWQVGTYAHLQNYYGVGFVLNWPGTSTFIALAYVEGITGNVIFSETLSAIGALSEALSDNVIIAESLNNEETL